MAEHPSDDVHIASFIVQVMPDQRAELERFRATVTGLETQPEDPVAPVQCVVICEGPDPGFILDRMDAIEQRPGVIGCTLVYHELMTSQEADQQLIAETRST